MKSTMLILIGYITCTLKCEINKTGAEEKTDNIEPPNDKDQQVVDVKQPKDVVQPGGKETTGAVEPPLNEDQPVHVEHSEDSKQPEDGKATEAVGTTVEATAVDTTYPIKQPDYTKQPEAAEITDAVNTTDGIDTNTTYTVEQAVNIEHSEDAKTENAVDKTNAVDTTDAIDITYAVEQPKEVEITEPKKKQEIQAENTGPSKIKVEDALKILEKSKKKYKLESIALIKKLEWLRSTFNITELMIDHKIDPNEDFDDLSNTESSLNSSNILRKRVIDGFLHVKHAILKISNFKKFLPSETTTEQSIAEIKEEAKRYKTNFIATHSDRDNLKKLYLQDSD